uniref:transcription factor MYB48-like n=1 Tax=Erigeron canadensis TaxID=72917 RepID=UPI001CB8C337|nr:transcription factor MYB48-like [Erigeron canadensis]
MGQDEETMRKGPWTEHEDFQLVFHVHMFGDRRWDFIANVSGLKRTGKSCRLRWVNYLNPGLKRGKLAPHEERLVLELHSKFGNRWSKIARKLPGRTDNEIKNYWRTHMRKKAQEKKRVASRSPSPSLSHCSSSSSVCTSQPIIDSMPMIETKERSFYDTGGVKMAPVMKGKSNYKNDNRKTDTNSRASNCSSDIQEGCYSMDEIWKDIGSLEDDDDSIKPVFDPYTEIAPSLTTWDNYVSSSWMMSGQDELSMTTFPITSQQFSSRL